MKTTHAPFDVADYLDNDKVIAEYISVAAEGPNPDVFIAAIGDVAKVRGIRVLIRQGKPLQSVTGRFSPTF